MTQEQAKLLGLAAAAADTAAADRRAAAGVESEEEEEEDSCRWSSRGSGEVGSYEEGEGSEEEEGDDDDDDLGGNKRKRMSADDRKARNRERNRLHARKTRQRKKQHVQKLQHKIWELRQDRQRLLQLSNDHRTAGVLLALSCSPKQCIQEAPRLPPALQLPAAISSSAKWSQEVASHEAALRKITREFETMDGSHQDGEKKDGSRGRSSQQSSGSGGGSRSGSRGAKGTLADRTALRRERNRMHAKRTRNRKKLFVEACSHLIEKMKVENAQLEHEIQALGVHLPEDSWVTSVRDTVPEEPLPDYLAALWDFAEGKGPKVSASLSAATIPFSPPTTARVMSGGFRHSRRSPSPSLSALSSTMSSSSRLSTSAASSSSANKRQQQRGGVATATVSKTPPPPPRAPSPTPSEYGPSDRPAAVLAAAANAVASSTSGQELEDASALCAFMEAAQTRSEKRARASPATSHAHQEMHGSNPAAPNHHQQRGWSDHGSTTSESRGGSEFSEEDNTYDRKPAVSGRTLSSSESGAHASPAFWTSRQVLERYVLPRQQLLQG